MPIATVAKNDGWQVEFYVLDTEQSAKGMYDTNKTIFENYESGNNVHATVTLKNYSTYMIKSSGYYMYLSRVDNTLLYVKVDDKYEDTVKSLVKDLGY